MRKPLRLLVIATVLIAVIPAAALAANAHLRKNVRPNPAFVDNGLTLTATAAYAGLGNFDTQQNVSAAYQSFEGGHMVWNGSTREIFILYNDGTYQTVQDTWTEGEVFNDGRTPPDGRYTPTRGFGKDEFKQVGRWMIEVVDALAKGGDTTAIETKVREEVKALTARFPIYAGPWG